MLSHLVITSKSKIHSVLCLSCVSLLPLGWYYTSVAPEPYLWVAKFCLIWNFDKSTFLKVLFVLFCTNKEIWMFQAFKSTTSSSSTDGDSPIKMKRSSLDFETDDGFLDLMDDEVQQVC